MARRNCVGLPTLAATLLCVFTSGAVAQNLAQSAAKYPDLSGEWHGSGNRAVLKCWSHRMSTDCTNRPAVLR